MRYIYICSEDVAQALTKWTYDFHYLKLSSGMVVVTANFSEELHELEFSGQPAVHSWHPLSGQSLAQTTIPPAIQKDLNSLFGISPSDSAFDASNKLSKVVPHFRIK